VLPELGVFAFGVVAHVNRFNPRVVVLGIKRWIGFGRIAEVAELFVIANAAVGAVDSQHGGLAPYCKWL
jgi:hypothetical protein